MASGAERVAPRCSSCQIDFTVKHILIECPAFSGQRRANFLTNKSIVDLLGDNGCAANVLKFLKDIGMFYDI